MVPPHRGQIDSDMIRMLPPAIINHLVKPSPSQPQLGVADYSPIPPAFSATANVLAGAPDRHRGSACHRVPESNRKRAPSLSSSDRVAVVVKPKVRHCWILTPVRAYLLHQSPNSDWSFGGVGDALCSSARRVEVWICFPGLAEWVPMSVWHARMLPLNEHGCQALMYQIHITSRYDTVQIPASSIVPSGLMISDTGRTTLCAPLPPSLASEIRSQGDAAPSSVRTSGNAVSRFSFLFFQFGRDLNSTMGPTRSKKGVVPLLRNGTPWYGGCIRARSKPRQRMNTTPQSSSLRVSNKYSASLLHN